VTSDIGFGSKWLFHALVAVDADAFAVGMAAAEPLPSEDTRLLLVFIVLKFEIDLMRG
jgi:hypothetical protein